MELSAAALTIQADGEKKSLGAPLVWSLLVLVPMGPSSLVSLCF